LLNKRIKITKSGLKDNQIKNILNVKISVYQLFGLVFDFPLAYSYY